MAKKLVGTGTYEVFEDEKGRPLVRVRGHLIESGQVFETILDDQNDIVKAISAKGPLGTPVSLDQSLA